MITVNSNGQPLSADFISALTANNRTYDARLIKGGSVLDCSITSITITKGSCGSSNAFTVGNIVGSTLVARVQGLNDAIKGEDIKVQIGLQVDEENETFEYVTLGTFTVSEAPQNVYSTTITAYGATITRTGSAFNVPATKTLANIASSIAASVSALAGRTVTVTFGTGIIDSDTITADMSNLTVYQALQILAGVVGGFVIDTYDGNIKICRFDDTPTITRDTDTMINLPVVEEEDFEVAGVICITAPATETTPASQFPVAPAGNENLIVQNKYVTEALYSSYLATLTGYTYRPADIGLTYGDPRLEGNDVVRVTDINEEEYVIPCHMLTHTYTGAFSTRIVSADATEEENGVATSAGSLTEQISNIGASAISARASAESAKRSADAASAILEDMEDAAEAAGTTLTKIYKDASDAADAADFAQRNAASAYASASQAIGQLSVVEDIVGVLDLLAQNGDYEVTSDTEVETDKWYFVRSGSGTTEDPYIYEVVTPAQGADPSGLGYYELVGIDQTIQNYVSSHLALAGNSLYLQNGKTKVELSTTNGMILYNENGAQIARYGTDAIIGDEYGFHVQITNNRLSFYRDGDNEVAYVSGDKLYITQSVVLQQMDIGTPASEGGSGQWSWCVHEISGQNNLYLKWLG